MSVTTPNEGLSMVTYVLVPPAGNGPWYWHLVETELRSRGHDVVAVVLPYDNDDAGLADYADAAVAQIGDRTDVVVVAQSLGGYTGLLVCDRVPAALLILLTAMVPVPGETPAAWWAATGQPEAMRAAAERDGRVPGGADDMVETFLHDVPAELRKAAFEHAVRQSGRPFVDPWPLEQAPDVPIRFLLCRDDRFFPADLMRRLARERLGLTADEMDGGHSVALSRPTELVERFEQLRAESAR
jgi:pimeloyl-ACP methyl ester carboxylesterase